MTTYFEIIPKELLLEIGNYLGPYDQTIYDLIFSRDQYWIAVKDTKLYGVILKYWKDNEMIMKDWRDFAYHKRELYLLINPSAYINSNLNTTGVISNVKANYGTIKDYPSGVKNLILFLILPERYHHYM